MGVGNQAIQQAVRSQSTGAPLDPVMAGRGRASLGAAVDDIRVHRGGMAQRAAAGAGATALTMGRDILLSAHADDSTLAHEMVHAVQPQAPGRVMSNEGDPAEREAAALAGEVLAGRPARATAGRAALSRQPVPTGGVRDPDTGWSFDPYAENVVGLGNLDLLKRMREVRDWLARHSMIELDYEAEMVLRDRLDVERDFRIDLGHLWLEDIDTANPALFRLMPGNAGAMDIVSVDNPELINGAPQDMAGAPIMNAAQLAAWQGRLGFPQISVADFLASRVPANDAPSGGTPLLPGERPDPFATPVLQSGGDRSGGMVLPGGMSYAGPRDRGLVSAFANQSGAGRTGAISEVYFGTGNPLGATNRNSTMANHPLTDFSMQSGPTPEVSLKTRVPGGANYDAPSRIDRFGNYLSGHAQLLGMDPAKNNFAQFMALHGNGRTEAQVRASLGLAVDASDVDAYRSLLSDPNAREPTPGGGVSAEPNYRRGPVSTIYNGVLRDRPIDVGDGGAPLRTVAEIDAALASNRIGVMQADSYLRGVGIDAAARVTGNPDFGTVQATRFMGAFQDMHPSLRPQAPGRVDMFSAARREGTDRAASASRVEQFDTYLARQAEMHGSGGQTLLITPADVPAYQGFLRDPFGREPTPTGRTSSSRNYARPAVSRVYDSVLAGLPTDRAVTSRAGERFNSVADIDAALTAGRLTAREHYELIDRTGRIAARSIAADTPAARAADATARVEYDAARVRANDYIRRNNSPEYMHSVGRGGGWGGDLHAAGSFGGRSAAIIGGVGTAMALWRHRDDDWSDSAVWADVGKSGGRDALHGGIRTGLETVAVSRTSQYLLREGLELGAARALFTRGAARFVPGGVVDAAFEIGDIVTTDRPVPAGEATYRVSRAVVIGAGSTAIGMATTAALVGSVVPGVGTAIGFVVGLAAGLILGAIIPSWDQLGQNNEDPYHGDIPMFRSDYERAAREGRLNCMGVGHHRKVHIIDDYMFDKGDAGTPLMGMPADPRAHTPMRLPNPMAMSDADRRALMQWIEAGNQADAGVAAR